MNFYASVRNKNSESTIRIHPLLLSLSETIDASETNPDLSAISEDDERVLGTGYYTFPSTFPLLEIHFPGQNGLFILPNQNGHVLISAAGCRECMASFPKDNSAGEGDANPEVNLVHMGSASLSTRNKRKRQQRASSGGIQGNLLNARGPMVAGARCRAKGKRAQKAGSWDADASPPEGESHEKVRDWEVEPCMFTEASVWPFANDICCLLMEKTMMQL